MAVVRQGRWCQDVCRLCGVPSSTGKSGTRRDRHPLCGLAGVGFVYTYMNSVPGIVASSSFVSGISASSTMIAAVARVAFALLDRVDILVLFGADSSPASPSAFLFGVVAGMTAIDCRANRSIASLDAVNASTASLIAEFPLNLDSWSTARHSGHFASVFRARRMQSEQKVWQQDVVMGELKNSLHTWHRSECSTCVRLAKGVPCQSLGSETS